MRFPITFTPNSYAIFHKSRTTSTIWVLNLFLICEQISDMESKDALNYSQTICNTSSTKENPQFCCSDFPTKAFRSIQIRPAHQLKFGKNHSFYISTNFLSTFLYDWFHSSWKLMHIDSNNEQLRQHQKRKITQHL